MESMARVVRALVSVASAAVVTVGCQRGPTVGFAAHSTLPVQDAIVRLQRAIEAQRKQESEQVKSKTRAEHPDWSAKQIDDYVKGYLSMTDGISPDTFAKSRAALDAARSLHCRFPRGAYVTLQDPTLPRHESAGAEVTFDAIDRQRHHARIIAKNGAGDVLVTTGPTALTFIEIAETGNPLVTVIFPRFIAGTRELFAADSEHIFMFSDISIGQYYGSCTVLE